MANYVMSDAEYRDICDLVYEHTGISLNDEKRKLVYSRFSKRLKELKLSTFREYCNLVKSDNGSSELNNFTNAITTNLTSFFRESHHFERLEQEIMPTVMKNHPRKIRIWSAGCSTGEEPYSLAITLLKAFPQLKNWDVKILATDLDSNVLDKASNGIYLENSFNGIDKNILKDWFEEGSLNGSKAYRAVPDIRNIISFKKLNLMDEAWPMKGPFDVIFCRNVLIYFDKETQQSLFDKFTTMQGVGDHLIIGHSETMKGYQTDYESKGRTTYKKIQ